MIYTKPDNVNSGNALIESERFIKSIPEYTGDFKGRGIVICGGGVRYFTNAWITINILRDLGCALPVELWYLGPEEMDNRMKSIVSALGVVCIDGLEMKKKFPARKLGGWELKAYAILHSKFEEVMLLDADNVPSLNPEYLFETKEYKETYAMFWPDPYFLAPDRFIWKICGVKYQHESEFESGQIVVNKKKCWKALNLAMWYNEYSDFYYKHVYGDKETFHMAFRKIEQPYHMISKPRVTFYGIMYQHDPAGKIVFQHRAGAKWNYNEINIPIRFFRHEKECFEHLARLKSLWSGKVRRDLVYKSDKMKLIVESLTSYIFRYKRLGYDERLMSFLTNGEIGFNRLKMEQWWDIFEENNTFFLEIYGHTEKTCVLELCDDNVWRGHWLDFEQQIAIELSALTASVTHAKTNTPVPLLSAATV